MQSVSANNFGLLIAFVLPGFTALWGASYLSPVLQAWLIGADASGPTVGGFLYVTLASVAAGLTVSTVRWLTIDQVHHRTGLRRPQWDFSRLQAHIAAYQTLNEIHYKFYQFNSNTLVSVVFVFAARRIHNGLFTADFDLLDLSLFLVVPVLFIGSRDTLSNYYVRANQFLGQARATDAKKVNPADDDQAMGQRREPRAKKFGGDRMEASQKSSRTRRRSAG